MDVEIHAAVVGNILSKYQPGKWMQTNSTEDTTTASKEPCLCSTRRKYDRNVSSSMVAATENRITQNAIDGE